MVCDVIAPHDGEVLFQAVQQKKNLGATTDAGLEALVAAYRKAPSRRSLTTVLYTILSLLLMGFECGRLTTLELES